MASPNMDLPDAPQQARLRERADAAARDPRSPLFTAPPPPPRLQEGTSRSWSPAEGPEERLRLRLLVPHSLVPLLIGKVRSAARLMPLPAC